MFDYKQFDSKFDETVHLVALRVPSSTLMGET